MEYVKDLKEKAIRNPQSTILISAAAYVTVKALCSITCWIKKCLRERHWDREAKRFREERDVKIESFLKIHKDRVTPEKMNLILSVDASSLIQLIHKKKVTAVEALITYIIRASSIGRDYGWVCDVDYENALKQAEVVDAKINRGEELGPLEGLPISIKDNISMKGMRNTLGATAKYNVVTEYDALVVDVLRKKGAIPFLLTSVPQGLMAIETYSGLWGVSRNPWNKNKVTGGSSGGEAGAIAARCSPAGIGSDIGGSIRVPSSFCGIYGLRPTSNRISKHGGHTYAGGQFTGFLNVVSSWGPMARSADDLILLSRNLFGEFGEDVYAFNNSFDESSFNRPIDNKNKPLTIGYILETSICETAPILKNTVMDVVSNLKKDGYILKEFAIDNFTELVQVGLLLMLNSGVHKHIINMLQGERLGFYFQRYFSVLGLPNWFRKMISSTYSLFGQKRMAQLIGNIQHLNRDQFIEKSKRFQELKSEFISYWKANGFDAIILPVFPTPAFDIRTSQDLLGFNHLSFIFNFLDLPSATIPITLCDDTSYKSKYNDKFSKLITGMMKTSEGLPITIQVGALPYQDELVLRLMKEIDSYYRFDQKHAHKVYDALDIKK